jgi:MtN3 and saliva related transmembrane protein
MIGDHLLGERFNGCGASILQRKLAGTRDTRSISGAMYTITVAGFAFWLVYGVMKREWPIIVTNAICLVMATFILTMKLLPQSKKDEVADTFDPGS